MSAFVRRHSLPLYFVLSFVGFWACLALGRIDRFRFFVPILGVLAPGVAALVLTGVTEGETGVRALLRRLGEWRVGPWYFVAVGLPLLEGLAAIAVSALLGAFSPARAAPPTAVLMVAWVMFLFAAVEELGWRGFALPRLLSGRSALTASLILGALHAVWHWPSVMPPSLWLSSPAQAARLLRGSTFIVAEAILLTWVFRNTRGSLFTATLYHGMSNAALLLYQGIDQARLPWLRPLISVVTALAVIAWTGPDLMRKRAPPGEPALAS